MCRCQCTGAFIGVLDRLVKYLFSLFSARIKKPRTKTLGMPFNAPGRRFKRDNGV